MTSSSDKTCIGSKFVNVLVVKKPSIGKLQFYVKVSSFCNMARLPYLINLSPTCLYYKLLLEA